MADIIDIASRRKPEVVKPTVREVADHSVEEIQGNWEKFARNNRLNEFFIQSIPTWGDATKNYLEDLNALSSVEMKIGLEPQVVAPGFSPDNSLGWLASFRINGQCITTSWMVSEQYARCFNILLFLKVKRELVTNGIPVTT